MLDFLQNSVFRHLGIFLSVLVVTVIIATIINRFFVRMIKKSTDELQTDPTGYLFLGQTVVAMVYLLGFSLAVYSMPELRTFAQSLLAGAGILAVAVGFAAQHALSNIISGMFLIIFKPFRVKDRLQVGANVGIVEEISLRHTVIRNFENQRIIIPNAVISDEVIINSNFGEDKICKWIDIRISYDSDIDSAKKIMREEVLKHPLHLDVRTPEQIAAGDAEVNVRVLGLGDSSVNLRTWAWAEDAPNGFVLSCDLYESIKKRFDAEGIEIPFPHRTLYKKN